MYFALSSVSGQGLSQVNHSPNPAFSNNQVTLQMSGWLPNPCWKVSGSAWNWSGNTVRVYINFDYDPPTPFCPQVLGDWNWNSVLGNLNAGSYSALIYNADTGQFLGSYSFVVQDGCQTPTTSQIFVSALTCNSATCNISISGKTGYGYRVKPVNSNSWSTINNISSTSFTFNNLLPNTQYEFQGKVWCGNTASGWSGSKYFNTCQSGTGVCSSPFLVTCGNTYNGHTLSGTNNYSSYSGSGFNLSLMTGREIFYQFTINQPGPVSISLTNIQSGQDLDLALMSSCSSNSVLAASTNAGNNNELISIGFLPAGTYKIVVDGWNNSSSSFTLSVQCNTSGCSTPSLSQLYTTSITSSTATCNCSYPGASFFDWRYRIAGMNNWTNLNASNLNFTNLSFLNPNTQYEFQCSVYCNGSWSNWSSSQYFTTIGYYSNNDEPCGAIELASNNSCYPISGSNINASSSWYPTPPTECNVTNMRDVWFKVQIPYTGKVKISTFSGSMYDAVVAFYYGGCNSLSGAVPTCFDVTNGDEMPDVTINSTPGTWWYIRVWGYGGSTGTFSICAQTIFSLVEGGDVVSEIEGIGNRTSQNKSIQEAENPTALIDAASLSVRIFPVPAQDEINISGTLSSESDVDITIMSVLGQVVQDVHLPSVSQGDFSSPINIHGLPAGSYMMRIKADGKELVRRFMKM